MTLEEVLSDFRGLKAHIVCNLHQPRLQLPTHQPALQSAGWRHAEAVGRRQPCHASSVAFRVPRALIETMCYSTNWRSQPPLSKAHQDAEKISRLGGELLKARTCQM